MNFANQISRGEVYVQLIRRGNPRPGTTLPAGTVGEMEGYFRRSDDQRLALVHQYRGPDGQLITRPDPKWLLDMGAILIPSHSDDERCAGCPPARV